MKLSALYLDRMVVIPGAGRPGAPSELREQMFTARDGWELTWLGDQFAIRREGMPVAVYVRGVGASYVAESMTPTPEPGPPAESDARVQVPQASPPNTNQRRKQR